MDPTTVPLSIKGGNKGNKGGQHGTGVFSLQCDGDSAGAVIRSAGANLLSTQLCLGLHKRLRCSASRAGQLGLCGWLPQRVAS